MASSRNLDTIPKLRPPCPNYARSKDGLISREEWLAVNEEEIFRMWESFRSYLEYTNSTILNKCTYVNFSDFVAAYSTHFCDYTSY